MVYWGDMSNPQADDVPIKPLHPEGLSEDAKQAFLDIALRREAQRKAEEEQLKERHLRAVKERETAGQEFQREVLAAKERSQERETWRRAKRAEAQQDREIAERERQQQALKEAQAKEEEAKQRERMEQLGELHRRAVQKKVQTQIIVAKHEEEKEVVRSEDHERNQLHDLHESLKRNLDQLERDERRALDKIRLEGERRRHMIEEKASLIRKDAERELQEANTHSRELKDRREASEILRVARRKHSDIVERAERERRREILAIEESALERTALIEASFKRLRGEWEERSRIEQARVERLAAQQRREAQARRSAVEERLGRGEKKQKDPRDPMS